jgi:hypothetical protein
MTVPLMLPGNPLMVEDVAGWIALFSRAGTGA